MQITFLLVGGFEKVKSSPESLFRANKIYNTQFGSGGKLRVGQVTLNKVFFGPNEMFLQSPFHLFADHFLFFNTIFVGFT